ncbi:MAG: hypothetical protein AMXMBFR33_23010 [Candidatus Xenobia bacterium]
MAIQITQTAFKASSLPSRASLENDGWTPRFDEPVAASQPIRAMTAAPVVSSLAQLVQDAAPATRDAVSLNQAVDLDPNDDDLRGVFAQMAMDRQTRVAARAQIAQTVQQDWQNTQEEVRANEQMRQANMSNMWRSAFNPYGGGMMPPMGPMPMTPGMPGMTPGMTPGMVPQTGLAGAYPPPPGTPYNGTFTAYPAGPGPFPTQTTYPAPPGTVGAQTYY